MRARSDADRRVDRYLRAVDHHLRGMPPAQRRRTLDELAAHIAEAREESGAPDDEPTVDVILERVGDPGVIAAEAAAGAGPTRRAGDAWAPWLLLFGGFLCVVGWFVGVVLLLGSPTWRRRDKLLGVLVWPFGLAAVALLVALPTGSVTGCGQLSGGVQHCTTRGFSFPLPVGLVVLAALVVGPLLTAWHLLRVRDAA